MSYLTTKEIETLGFKSVGNNVKISRFATFYGTEHITIGSNTRIDNFCVISASEAGISIGDYVHVAVYCFLTGKSPILLEDFVGISSRVAIYSSNDDYSGNYLTGPCVPSEFSNVESRTVELRKHVIVGANSTILPGVTIGKGSAVGAYSLVNQDLPESIVAVGIPAKSIKSRKTRMFQMEEELKNQSKDKNTIL